MITVANRLVVDRIEFSDGIVGVGPEDPDEYIKEWLGMGDLKRLLKSNFKIPPATSVIPMGHRGMLQIVNSHKHNQLLGQLVTPQRLETLKERLGLGFSIFFMEQELS